MKIKWSPCAGRQEQQFLYVDENTININGEDYSFQIDAIIYPDVWAYTNGAILEAHRESGELYLTVIRFYPGGHTPVWDTGVYNDYTG